MIRRIATASWLLIFMMSGLMQALGMTGDNPEVGYATTVLLIGVAGLVCFGVIDLAHGLVRLTLVAGFIVIVINHALNLVYGYDWFEGLWYFTPAWLRYMTYGLLGYSFARVKGLRIAVVICVGVAIVEDTARFLALLPTQAQIGGLEYLGSQWPWVVRGIVGQAMLLGLTGALGAAMACIPLLRNRRALA